MHRPYSHDPRMELAAAAGSEGPGSKSCQLRLLLAYERVSVTERGEGGGRGGGGTESSSGDIMRSLLPINSLRNMALLAADTPLVTMVDVDLLIDQSLSRELMDDKR